MQRIVIVFLLLSLFFVQFAVSQTFRGEVVDSKSQPLPFANILWEGTNIGTASDEKGAFQLPFPADTSAGTYRLVVSFSTARDTFEFDDLYSEWVFNMDAEVTFEEVVIRDQATGAYISKLQPIKTEIINRNELRKAACCDLAGCFETQATVQPQTTNILTNAKELRILGLSGVYNQILMDGLPLIQGMTYTYGISTIPGSVLENIWVTKGANSVLQGYESMVGQITLFPREGGTAEPFTADVLLNSFGEEHLNAAMAIKGKKWTNYLAVHTAQPGMKLDRDGDRFLDLPLLTRYSFYNKWRFRKENEKGVSAFIGARLVDEERIGGQTFFDPQTDLGSTRAYGQVIRFRQPEIFTKSGWRFDDNNKLSLLASAVTHRQDSWFGVLHYTGDQKHYYANLQHELFYGKKREHDFKAGISFRYLNISERLAFSSDTLPRTFAGTYERRDLVPGIFVENILNLREGLVTLISGFRADKHQDFGWFFTPRAMLRISPKDGPDVRLSAGTGWRTVNLFSENINLLTSGRDIFFKEKLEPEKSFNTGINATQQWTFGTLILTATADAYHTRFQNQFFPDYDTDINKAIIANFTKPSMSNGVQAEVMIAAAKQVEFRLAYNYLDVWRKPETEKVQLPYNSRHRLLGVFSIHSKDPLWQVDINAHWYGKQRLPDTKNAPQDWALPEYSAPFSILSLQYSHTFKGWEAFAGCENVFDFRQIRPILGYENPFSRGFDTSFAWGPTKGRELYLGLRIRMKKDSEESGL